MPQAFPVLGARWSGVSLGNSGTDEFFRLTGMTPGPLATLLYLHTAYFPLQFALLTHHRFPQPFWGSMQHRNHLLLHRPVDWGTPLTLESHLIGGRSLEKGVELELHNTAWVDSGGRRTLVWESLVAYYYRGRVGVDSRALDSPSPLAVLPPVTPPQANAFREDAEKRFVWAVPRTGDRAFARLTGDYNGTHINRWYARLMGFPSPFSHAQRVLGMSLARLPAQPGTPQNASVGSGPAADHDFDSGALRLDVWLKGPVYYHHPVRLQSAVAPEDHAATWFNLFLAGEGRPALRGRLATVPPGSGLLDEQQRPLKW